MLKLICKIDNNILAYQKIIIKIRIFYKNANKKLSD